MNLYARRRMMRKTSRIPSAYQEVEWIKGESCRMYLGYVPKISPRVITKMAINAAGDYDAMGFTSNTAPSFIIDVSYNGTSDYTDWYNRYGSTSKYSFNHQLIKDVPNTYEFGPIVYVDGVQKANPGIFDWSNNNQEFMLFMGRTRHPGVTFYNFSLYDGDNLIKDLVPCYRKTDNVIGMYDLISKTFITSDVGTLSKGPNI